MNYIIHVTVMADLYNDITYEGWGKTATKCYRECMGILYSRPPDKHHIVTRRWQSQVLLAVTLWLSGVVVNRTFTLGGVGVHACLFMVIAQCLFVC